MVSWEYNAIRQRCRSPRSRRGTEESDTTCGWIRGIVGLAGTFVSGLCRLHRSRRFIDVSYQSEIPACLHSEPRPGRKVRCDIVSVTGYLLPHDNSRNSKKLWRG